MSGEESSPDTALPAAAGVVARNKRIMVTRGASAFIAGLLSPSILSGTASNTTNVARTRQAYSVTFMFPGGSDMTMSFPGALACLWSERGAQAPP